MWNMSKVYQVDGHGNRGRESARLEYTRAGSFVRHIEVEYSPGNIAWVGNAHCSMGVAHMSQSLCNLQGTVIR
jgi:hypothetical protein